MNGEMSEFPVPLDQLHPQQGVWMHGHPGHHGGMPVGFPPYTSDQRGYHHHLMPSMAAMQYGMYEVTPPGLDEMPEMLAIHGGAHAPYPQPFHPPPLIVPPIHSPSVQNTNTHPPYTIDVAKGPQRPAAAAAPADPPPVYKASPVEGDGGGVTAAAGTERTLGWYDISIAEGVANPIGTASRAFLSVTADKGFSWVRGHGFTCYKKNHFQLTVQMRADGLLTQVALGGNENSGKKVTGMYIEMFGVKSESHADQIQLLQASVLRDRYPLQRQVVTQDEGTLTASITVRRLHFSTATTFNVRKKGKANPLQKYFKLVVRLIAQTSDGCEVPIKVLVSDQFVVRASASASRNNESGLTWQEVPEATAPKISSEQNVGINYMLPDEHLTVGGNVKITGEMYQPSDCRVKTTVTPLDVKADLAAVRRLELQHYTLRPEWAGMVGRSENPDETGVIAQQLAALLPDAVKRTAGVGCKLADGSELQDLLLVKKERLGTALVAAIQATAMRGDTLRRRLQLAERETEFLLAQLGRVCS